MNNQWFATLGGATEARLTFDSPDPLNKERCSNFNYFYSFRLLDTRTTSTSMAEPKKIIIDTDPGIGKCFFLESMDYSHHDHDHHLVKSKLFPFSIQNLSLCTLS